jgi:hypothetical protein
MVGWGSGIVQQAAVQKAVHRRQVLAGAVQVAVNRRLQVLLLRVSLLQQQVCLHNCAATVLLQLSKLCSVVFVMYVACVGGWLAAQWVLGEGAWRHLRMTAAAAASVA